MQKRTLHALLICAFALAVWVVSPLWIGMLLGTVMAFAAEPVCQRVTLRTGGRIRLAAGLTTVGYGVLTAAVGSLFVYVFTQELLKVGALLQQTLETGSLQELIGSKAAHFVEKRHLDQDLIRSLKGQLGTLSSYAATLTGMVAEKIASAVATWIVALLTMYFVLLEWVGWMGRLEKILPLHPRHTQALMQELQDMGKGAFVGALGAACIQGVLGCLGYVLSGLANPVTWGLATALASFLPLVGTALVWGPLGLYLLLDGHLVSALFVWGWGLLVVTSLTDYVLRPLLLRSTGSTHPLLTLLSLLGGIEVFGLPGIVVAPMLMSLWLAVLHIYERDTNLDE